MSKLIALIIRNISIILVFISISLALTACLFGGGGGGGDDDAGPTQTPIQNASVDGCFVEDYPSAATSQYILPYQVGMSYTVNQGNCGRFSTHRPNCDSGGVPCGDERYAYDFSMPIGTTIIATRGGEVTLVIDTFPNTTTTAFAANTVTILHTDGTVGSYVHLSPNAFVAAGDIINQGDPIGLSGESGFTGLNNPHLHFQVDTPPFVNCAPGNLTGCVSIPITFRNASPLDAPLIEDSTYMALTF